MKQQENLDFSDITGLVSEPDNIKPENKRNNSVDLKPQPKKRLYLGYKPRLVVFSFAFLVLFALTLYFARQIIIKTFALPTTYTETISEPDYRVYLKPNDFYTERFLPKNKAYVASLIQSIKVNYQYIFGIDDITNVDFDYKVLADLIIENTNGKELGKKEYTIVDSTKKSMKGVNEYVITEDFDLDYGYYNQLANSFRAQYGVDTTSYLKVYMTIQKNSVGDKYTIDESNSYNIVLIPLSERVIEINIKSVSNSVTKEATPESMLKINYKILALVLFLLFCTLVALLRVIRCIARIVRRKTPYDRYVNRLLKEYDRLIVEINTEFNFADFNVIEVDKFSELLDVRDNVKMPINYYNLIKGQEGIFFIRSNNDIYLLTVRNSDIENKTLDTK